MKIVVNQKIELFELLKKMAEQLNSSKQLHLYCLEQLEKLQQL